MEETVFTKVQQEILRILADGYRHKRDEVLEGALPEGSSHSNLHPHLSYLRKKLRPRNEDVICEFYQGGIYYRHVRLIAPSTDE